MSTDEHNRLKDEVVEAADRFWARPLSPDESLVRSAKCIRAVQTLRDYLWRSSTSEAVKTCEPPGEFRQHRFHWLSAELAWEPGVCEWMSDNWYPGNEVGPVSPEEMHRRGYEWYSPCFPPDTEVEQADARIEPTDEQLDALWVKTCTTHGNNNHLCDYARAVLAHFSPTSPPTADWLAAS